MTAGAVASTSTGERETNPAPTFLGVESSIGGRRWTARLGEKEAALATAIAQRTGLPDIVARVLAGRGVGADEAASFLDPTIRALMPDPSSLTDMDRAATRIADAIDRSEKIAIFGDYDVDGATSAALLARYLSALGLDPSVTIPDRLFDGYGPNPDMMRRIAEGGATLLVTVDCGTTSFEALDVAASLGLETVVIDHHRADAALPKALAIVNPNRQDDLSGLGHLAAVGVTFLVLVAVSRILRARHGQERALPDLLDLLDLVALGTVCDVVPLIGLNRAFVRQGLAVLGRRKRPGLVALARVARLDGPLTPYHLGFMLGPRINAGGRIGNATLGARLLGLDDAAEADRIAAELDRLNAERQALEAAMLAEAIAEADAEIGAGPGPSVLVTANPAYHIGVVGLIAARLKERFNRPAIAIALGPDGGGTGSARSVPGVDLGRAIREAVAAGLLVKGGGHAMAAGLTIGPGRLGELRAFLEERLGPAVAASRSGNGLRIDAAMTARGASLDFIDLVEKAGPYGTGHAEPVFVLPSHRIAYAEVVGSGHVRASLAGADRATIKAIAFRAAESALGRALLQSRGMMLHVAGAISADHWNGRRTPGFRIIDAAPFTSPIV